MSSEVDQRIVEMQFNNRQFESGAQETISTLDKLKKSLDLKGASKGLESVSDAAKKCDMSVLQSAVESVRNKFSALEVMGVTALANITNSAVNAGKRIASALTIDPIKTGFDEYETKINSIQTIMSNTASKGTTMEDVTRVIDELNTYADKTIYNFSEMTRNIGTFTAAGVGLEESAKAIQGIANLAAASGSNSQQASVAMYQLSQALAAGTVKLMDWNSVVNAGMGGEKFQEALKQTAREHDVAVDDMIEKNGSFRDSLQEGWLSADILNETLNKFTVDGATNYAKSMVESGKWTQEQADALISEAQAMEDAATKVKTFSQLWSTLQESVQSGWSKTWEIVIGDFEEAKSLFTEISDTLGKIISDSADARNEVLFKGLSSGWDQLLNEGISDEAEYIETVKTVAKEHGIAIDSMIEKEGSFENTLKNGWVTSDILAESISKLTDKTRGLSDEELKNLGYTREQVDALEKLDESVKNGSVSLDYFAKKMAVSSGRENLITALRNSFQGLLDVIKPVKDAFREVFPPVTGEQLYNITVKIKELTENFKISEATALKIKDTFKGLFSIISIGKEVLSSLISALGKVVKSLIPAGNGILEITSSLGGFVTGIDKAVKETGIFKTVFGGLASALSLAAKGISLAINTIAKGFGKLGDVDFSLFEMLEKAANAVSKAFGKLKEVFGNVMGGLGFDNILDVINGGVLTAVLLGVKKFISSLTEITSGGSGILKNVKALLDGVKGSLEAWQSSIQANTILKIGAAIGILAASILVLSTIDPVAITTSLGAITGLFVELFGSMVIFEKIMNGNGIKSVGKVSVAMISLSTAVLILSNALQNLSELNWSQVASGLTAVGVLMGELIATSIIMDKNSAGMVKGSAGLILFSTSLVILSNAVKSLGELPLEQIGKGLLGVGALLGSLAVFFKMADFDGLGMSKGTGILLLATSIQTLSKSVSTFSEMDVGKMIQGLSAVGTLLAELAIFTKVTANTGSVLSTAVSMNVLGTAMLLFASSVSSFSEKSWGELGRGLLGFASSLAAVVAVMRLLPKNMAGSAVSLVAVSSAMVILSKALGNMGDMNLAQIAKSLISLAGSLGVIVGAMKLMTGTLPGAAALLVVSSSLMALTPVLLALGTMSLSSIATSLIVLAGSFTVIGAAGLALSPITPALIGLSAAIALVGAGCLAAGAGVLAFSTGLTALAVAFTASGAAIVTGIKELLNLIPLLAENIGKGIVAMATAIGNGSEAIGEAFKKIVLSITASLTECIPAIAEGVLKIITEVLTSLAAHTPQIVDSIFEFLIGILEGVARNLPSLIQSAVNVLMSFFTGIVDAIKSIDTSALLKGIAGIGLMAGIMAALGAVAGLIPGAMVGVLGMGAVIAELALVLAAVGGLAQIPGLSWLIDEGGKLLQGIGTAIGSFVGGIVGGFMGGISSQFPQIGADLSAFMTNARPFIEGVSSIDSSVMSGMASLAGAILTLTAANVLEGLTSWFTGGTSLAAFGAELAAFAPYFKAYYDSINGIDGSVVEASANAALALAEFASKIPNSGGLAAVLAGENSLSAFADELIVFGPKLKAYADSVSGLNADVVTNSANAALALAEFASKLPNSGGAVSWFAGNNDLSGFAEELCKFGPSLKKYADSVSGLNADVVKNSANAASALAELASNLPNSGGVVSWFTGDNEIDKFGSELAAFGPKFKEYADSISGLDAGVVTNSANAASALSALANSLPNSGGVVSWFTGDNDIAAFGESLSSFGAYLKTYYDHVSGIDITQLSAATNELSHLSSVLSGIGTINSDAVSSFGKVLSSIADSGVKSFITSINNATSQVQQAASDLITAFVNAVNAKKDTVTSTFSGVTSSIITTMNASKSSFTTVGDNIVKGVANGITDTTFYAEAKARAMARAAYNAACEELGIRSPSLEFQYIGEMIGKGLEKGIVKSGQDAIDASTDVADTLTSASEKSYDDLTKWISDNEYFGKISLDEELYVWRKFQSRYEQGTDERMKADKEIYRLIQEISKADYQHSMDWISDQKSKNELSLQEELAAYERMQSRFEWGSEERKNIDKEIYRLRNELVTESYQHSLDWIENEKYHNRLSLEEELAAYERMQSRYEWGSEERKQIDKEIYRLRNELIAESYQNSMDWIEEEKYYNRMSLADELAAYTRVQQRYDKGTEERKKMDREVYRVQQEIYEARKNYEDELSRIQEEAGEKRLQLEQEYADKTKEINDQLAQDIQAAEDKYTSALESRTDALYDSYGLFDEVTKKDPVSSSDLMDNLQQQVDEFSDWQKELDLLSSKGLNEGLIEELRKMGPSAIEEIKALNSMTDSQLSQYASLWATKHKLAKDQAKSELENLRLETQSEIEMLQNEADDKLEEYRETWEQQMEDLEETTTKQTRELAENFLKEVGVIKPSTEEIMKETTETAKDVLLNAGWSDTGQKIMDGLTAGIKAGSSSFVKSLLDVVNGTTDKVSGPDGIDAHSPSKVYEKLGRYMDEGLIVGIKKYGKKVASESVKIGKGAVAAMLGSLSLISDIASGNINISPRIRPILEMDDVVKKIGYMDHSFRAERSLALSAAVGVSYQNEIERSEALVQKIGDITAASNEKVVSAIDSLKDDFADLLSRFEQLKLVMDTGALVGALASDMDAALGNIAVMNERGV